MADPKSSGPAKPPGAPQGSTWAALRRFWPLARPHRRWLYVGLATIPIVAAVSALRPLLVQQAVDVDIAAGDLLSLRVTALLFLVAVMVEFFALAVQVFALQQAGNATISDLRGAIFRHVLAMPARFYDKTPIGALLSRSTSDVEALSETLAFGVFTSVLGTVLTLPSIPAGTICARRSNSRFV